MDPCLVAMTKAAWHEIIKRRDDESGQSWRNEAQRLDRLLGCAASKFVADMNGKSRMAIRGDE